MNENKFDFCEAGPGCSDPNNPDEPRHYETRTHRMVFGIRGKVLDWLYSHKATEWLYRALATHKNTVCLTHKLMYEHGLWPRETKYGVVYVPDTITFGTHEYIVQIRKKTSNTDSSELDSNSDSNDS